MSISLQKLKRRAPQPVSTDKPSKKCNRFEGLSETELMSRKSSLQDYLQPDLDIVFVGINPSLAAAYTGHYYAGPGNHFYPLLHHSGLVSEPVTHEDDERLLQFRIGLTNIVARATRSSADLSRLELKKGAALAQQKLKQYKPRVAVFNGKCIYEEFAEGYDRASFRFGLQPQKVGETSLWVVPSSSARCANFPRMQDKLHFYTALKKYLAYLKGEIKDVDLKEFVFDGKCRQAVPSTSKMWRRKGISAFANGGRIVNKETICMDTSDENVLSIPTSNEFIVKSPKKKEIGESEEDSGLSGSQSVASSQYSRHSGKSDDVTGNLSQASKSVEPELSQESKADNDENDLTVQSDTKPKRRQINKRSTKDKLPSRVVPKERTETIDFVSLIKQRLSNKGEVSNDDRENCLDDASSQANGSVKALKYENLRSNKTKRGFTIKNK